MRFNPLCVRVLCILIVVVAIGPSTDRAEDIVVGMSAAFTGPSRGLGIELYRGSKAHFDDVNEKGGIHGHKIVIKAYDDGYNPVPALRNTIKLIQEDKVFLLFDYVGTPTVTRCLPMLQQHHEESILLFFPFSGAEPQWQPPYDKFVFNLRASYYDETRELVDHFIAVGRKRIAVFYQIDSYGRNGWEGVRAALTKHGLKMVGEATYRRGTPFKDSMKQQVDILRAVEPDAVISIGAYSACAAFIRDARDAGWNVPIANVSFVGSENMLALLKTAGAQAGKDYTQDLINSQVVPSYTDSKLSAVGEYRLVSDRLKVAPPPGFSADDYHSPTLSFVGLEGFLNAKLLTAILQKMGPPFERSRLKTAAESLTNFNLGIDVPITFGPDDHVGSEVVYFTVVRNGGFETLDNWKRWQK